MSSFKNAVHSPVTISGVEGAYTQDNIDDKLPDGYYRYYLMFNNEQAYITDEKPVQYEGVVITKNAVTASDISAKAVSFEDKEFNFENFFTGFHRPIDFQIKTAEDKRNQQFQDKSRSKDKNLGRDDL